MKESDVSVTLCPHIARYPSEGRQLDVSRSLCKYFFEPSARLFNLLLILDLIDWVVTIFVLDGITVQTRRKVHVALNTVVE